MERTTVFLEGTRPMPIPPAPAPIQGPLSSIMSSSAAPCRAPGPALAPGRTYSQRERGGRGAGEEQIRKRTAASRSSTKNYWDAPRKHHHSLRHTVSHSPAPPNPISQERPTNRQDGHFKTIDYEQHRNRNDGDYKNAEPQSQSQSTSAKNLPNSYHDQDVMYRCMDQPHFSQRRRSYDKNRNDYHALSSRDQYASSRDQHASSRDHHASQREHHVSKRDRQRSSDDSHASSRFAVPTYVTLRQFNLFDREYRLCACCCRYCHICVSCVAICLVELASAAFIIVISTCCEPYQFSGLNLILGLVHALYCASLIVAVAMVLLGIARDRPEWVTPHILLQVIGVLLGFGRLGYHCYTTYVAFTAKKSVARSRMHNLDRPIVRPPPGNITDLSGNHEEKEKTSNLLKWLLVSQLLGLVAALVLAIWFIKQFRHLQRFLSEHRAFITTARIERYKGPRNICPLRMLEGDL